MYATHEGLRHDYEVSFKELDFLVDFTKDHQEVLGARIMGGGFGGCSINLIHQDYIEAFIKKLIEACKTKFDIELNCFEAIPSSGVRTIKN